MYIYIYIYVYTYMYISICVMLIYKHMDIHVALNIHKSNTGEICTFTFHMAPCAANINSIMHINYMRNLLGWLRLGWLKIP